MGRSMSIKVLKPADAKVFFDQYLEEMEHQLNADFLFGATPTIADFSAYHTLWLIRSKAESKALQAYPRLNHWMDRMDAFGDGNPEQINPKTALEVARKSEPRAIAEALAVHPDIGKQVAIMPSDYAQVASQGILVGSSEQRWILSRPDSTVGNVHVHFPKAGFELNTI